MISTYQILACIVAIATPALAQGDWQGQWNGPVVTVTQYPSSSSIVPRSPYPTPAPTPGSGGGNGQGGGAQTFSIVNSYSVALSLSFDHNPDGPGGFNDVPTTIGAGSTTFYSYPTGWAGRIYVGKTTNPANSKIEGSIKAGPDMDVSYVDGYSVPIVCTSAGKVGGSNTELFGLNGNKCGQNVDISGFEICPNPALPKYNGPADPFFAPCQGKAYTYPADNLANMMNVDATTHCCIGTTCSMGPGKRSVLSEREGAPPSPDAHPHQVHKRRWNQPRSHVHRLVQDAKLKH
ncbi:hypothetical protein G7Y79_00007g021340 [Physcia stellaris]|nr:hypothetical protein G7Y79_00007g021340 [Physcia stellaris]